MQLTSRLLLVVLLLVTAVASPARADDDPDTEVARRLFKQGSTLYIAGDYQKALELFEKARLARPLPAFDFNIARCHDRLGRWTEALAEAIEQEILGEVRVVGEIGGGHGAPRIRW